MTKHEDIDVTSLAADLKGVLDRVERERVTVTIKRGDDIVAVLSPPRLAETLADLHRAMLEEPPDSEFYLDVMETRRLLGL